MSVVNAKAKLNPQLGDPVTGFISKTDIQDSYDDLEDGWRTDSQSLEYLPAGSMVNVKEANDTYVRPTERTDICVVFTGVSDPGGIAFDGDKWDRL